MTRKKTNGNGEVIWESNPILDEMKDYDKVARVEENDHAKLMKLLIEESKRKAKEGNTVWLNNEDLQRVTGKTADQLELELDIDGEVRPTDLQNLYKENIKKTTRFDEFLEKDATDKDYVDLLSGEYDHIRITDYISEAKDSLLASKFNNVQNNEKVYDSLSRTGDTDKLYNLRKIFLKGGNLNWNTIDKVLSNSLWESPHEVLNNRNFTDEHAFKIAEKHPVFFGGYINHISIPQRARDIFLENDDNWGTISFTGIQHIIRENKKSNTPDGNLFGDERDKLTPKFASQLLKNATGHLDSKNLDLALGSIDEDSRNTFINAKLGITNGSHQHTLPEETDSPEAFNDVNWDNWSNGNNEVFQNDYSPRLSSVIANSRYLTDDHIEHIKRHGSFNEKYELYHNENIDPRHGIEMYKKWSENHTDHGYDADELIEAHKDRHDDIFTFDDLPEDIKDEITQDDHYYQYVDESADEAYNVYDYLRDHEDDVIERMGSDYDNHEEIYQTLLDNHDWYGENPDFQSNNPQARALDNLNTEHDYDLDSYSFTVDELKNDYGIDISNLGIEADEHKNVDGEDLLNKLNGFGGPSKIDYVLHEDGIDAHPEFEDRYEEEANDWRINALNNDSNFQWAVIDGLYLYEDQRESEQYQEAYNEARDRYLEEEIDQSYFDDLYETAHQDDRFIPDHIAEAMPDIQEIRERRRKAKLSVNIDGIPDRKFEHEYGENQHAHELALDYAKSNNDSVDIGRLHKKHPNLKETWKKIFNGKGKLSSEEIQQKIDNIDKTKYDISYGEWGKGRMQNLNNRNQIVVRLDHSDESLKPIFEHEDSNVKDMFKKVQKVSQRSGHPTNDRTIAWARVDISDPKHWMIDEVQSDFGKTVTSYLKEQGHGDKANAVNTIADLHKNWRETLINHVLKTAKDHGAEKVSTHSPESKHAHAAYGGSNIHSVYKDSYKKVPRKMGFKESEAKDLPLTESGMKYFKTKTEDKRSEDISDHQEAHSFHINYSNFYNDYANSLYTKDHLPLTEESKKLALSLSQQHKDLSNAHAKKLTDNGAELDEKKHRMDSFAIEDAETHMLNNDSIRSHSADSKVNKPMGQPSKEIEFKGHTYDLNPKLNKYEYILLPRLMKSTKEKYAYILKKSLWNKKYPFGSKDGILNPGYNVKKAEELMKGSRQRKMKFDPNSVDDQHRMDVETWVGGYSEDPQKIRSNIDPIDENAKKRALNKIHAKTKVRKHPETGERMFLLHRGVGPMENNNFRNNNLNYLSSWTSDYHTAHSFAMDYKYDFDESFNNDHEKEYGYKVDDSKPHVWSAWIPESKIHHIPNAIGSKSKDLDQNWWNEEDKIKEPLRRDENEIIVRPHRLLHAHDDHVKRLRDWKKTLDPNFDNRTLNEKINDRGGSLDKSEWKKRYSYILETDIQKGKLANTVAAAGLITSLNYMGAKDKENIPNRSLASSSYSKEIEAPKPKTMDRYENQIKNVRKKYFMNIASGNNRLEASKAAKVYEKTPNLREKYKKLHPNNHFEISQTMKKDPDFEKAIHSKHFDDLYQKYDGHMNKIAHAWKYGPQETDRYLKSGKAIDSHPWVKKFYSIE